MEIFFNTSIVIVAALFVLSLWGMLGAVIMAIAGVDLKSSPEALIAAVAWPIVLVFVWINTLIGWMSKQ